MDYCDYLRSDKWRAKRNERLSIDHHKCVICGCSKKQMNVHHLTYDRIMNEDVEKDLITLCEDCHRMLHRIKESARIGHCKCKGRSKETDEALKKKLFELTAVEIWQRGYSPGGDLGIFNGNCKAIHNLCGIIKITFPDSYDSAFEDKVVDAIRVARAMRVCELSCKGFNSNDIAKELHMSPTRVLKLLKRHGFNKRAKIK